MTSRDARRDTTRQSGPPQLRNMADCGAAAVERLESALYRIETGAGAAHAQSDALASIAASLIRLAGSAQPHPPIATNGYVEQQLAAVIAELAQLRDAVRDVAARVDRLEDTP